jgi:hypothetical protein
MSIADQIIHKLTTTNTLCSWEGCTSETETRDGWSSYQTDIPPDSRRGYLCPYHREIFERVAAVDQSPRMEPD